MNAFVTDILGEWGVKIIIFVIIFMVMFRYSHSIFSWIEDKMFSNKEYILEKCDLLYWKVNSDKVTIWLLITTFIPGLIVMMVLMFFGYPIIAVFAGIIIMFGCWKAPKPIINFFINRRIKEYENQMVDGMQLLANGLRAGQSLPQSFAMVVDELPPPISQEFNYILQQNKIGNPIEECMENFVKRMPTEDNEMFVTSVNILFETGGNLAETFDTIVGIIRERIRLKQKIETYVAQGMFQGLTIFCMPFVIGGLFFLSDPEGMSKIFQHPVGIALLIFAIILDFIGLAIIMKIVKIKV